MAKKKTKTPSTLTAQLRDCILDSGLTRYAVAKRVGMDLPQLMRFLSTGKGISMAMLDRIGLALNLRIVRADDGE